MAIGFKIDKNEGGKWYVLSLLKPLFFVFAKSSDGKWKNSSSGIEEFSFVDFHYEAPFYMLIIGPYCFMTTYFKK